MIVDGSVCDHNDSRWFSLRRRLYVHTWVLKAKRVNPKRKSRGRAAKAVDVEEGPNPILAYRTLKLCFL